MANYGTSANAESVGYLGHAVQQAQSSWLKDRLNNIFGKEGLSWKTYLAAIAVTLGTTLYGAIVVKKEIDKLEITLANTLASHSQRMEIALDYIVNNLPSERFSPEKRAEIRKGLEGIFKKKQEGD